MCHEMSSLFPACHSNGVDQNPGTSPPLHRESRVAWYHGKEKIGESKIKPRHACRDLVDQFR